MGGGWRFGPTFWETITRYNRAGRLLFRSMQVMRERGERQSARIEVIPAAPEHQTVLAHLLELYAHDFSEFYDVEIGPDGRFGYSSLPLYWSEAGRHPLLVWLGGKLAGFVLMKRGSDFSGKEDVWDMAEFFVLRGYRRRGIGTRVAQEVWGRFPGAWEVRVMESNTSAHHFWERAIAEFMGEAIDPVRVEKDGTGWRVFLFERG